MMARVRTSDTDQNERCEGRCPASFSGLALPPTSPSGPLTQCLAELALPLAPASPCGLGHATVSTAPRFQGQGGPPARHQEGQDSSTAFAWPCPTSSYDSGLGPVTGAGQPGTGWPRYRPGSPGPRTRGPSGRCESTAAEQKARADPSRGTGCHRSARWLGSQGRRCSRGTASVWGSGGGGPGPARAGRRGSRRRRGPPLPPSPEPGHRGEESQHRGETATGAAEGERTGAAAAVASWPGPVVAADATSWAAVSVAAPSAAWGWSPAHQSPSLVTGEGQPVARQRAQPRSPGSAEAIRYPVA